MTITIGRFGTDISVGNPMQFTRSGDRVTVEGWVEASSTATMNALIQQLNGLVGPDEPIVPLTYSYDSTWDGYYRVGGVTHSVDPNWERTFKFRYQVELERFAAYPIVEMITLGAARAGDPGITEQPWHSVPSTWLGYDYGAATAIVGSVTRALTASVNMNVYEHADFYDTTATAGVAPADYYTGASTVKVGSGLYVAQGRQVVNTPAAWELSNGLLKVGASSGAGNHWTLSTMNAGGTAFSAATGITLGYNQSSAYAPMPYGVTPRSLTVLRNSPEESVIRLAYQPETANSVSVEVDLGLRRGARHCTVTLRTHNQQGWGMGFETAVACSYISFFHVGIVETSNNAAGNKNFMGITQASTPDLTNGSIMVTSLSSTVMDGYFGCSPGGSGAASPDKPNEVEAEYYAAVSEKQRMAPQ